MENLVGFSYGLFVGPGLPELLVQEIHGHHPLPGKAGEVPSQHPQVAVQVFLDGEQPYVAQTRQRILEYQIPQLSQGGAVVAVRVDPADPQRIAIDFQSEAPVVTVARAPDGGAERVLETGLPAELVIVANTPLGVRNYLGHDVHLFTLTVSVPGQAPYQVQLGNPVPAAALPLLYPGSKVPGKVVAGEPNSVAIDWDAAIAAQA